MNPEAATWSGCCCWLFKELERTNPRERTRTNPNPIASWFLSDFVKTLVQEEPTVQTKHWSEMFEVLHSCVLFVLQLLGHLNLLWHFNYVLESFRVLSSAENHAVIWNVTQWLTCRSLPTAAVGLVPSSCTWVSEASGVLSWLGSTFQLRFLRG